MRLARDDNNQPLPVPDAAGSGDVLVVAGTYTVTVPTGAQVLVIESEAGTIYARPSVTGAETPPSPNPPESNVTDGSAVWQQIDEGTNIPRAVAVGDRWRVNVPSSARAHIWYY